MPDGSNFEVVWQAIPNSSQELAMSCKAHHILYAGSRGPGKSDAQLMRFRRYVGVGYGPFWRGIIIDRDYKSLDDLVAKAKRWFYAFNDGAKFVGSQGSYKWTWPTGEELVFRAMRREDDYWSVHGQEFPFIGWNELCKYPVRTLYEMVMSTNRSSYTPEKDGFYGDKTKPAPEPIPLNVFSTTNSYGPGFGWVKRMFIDPAPYGAMVRIKTKIFNPRTKKNEEIETTQVTIFGSYRENIYLDPVYIATLNNVKDPNKRKSWLAGSWDIVAGGALDDVWQPSVHIIPRFVVPHSWHVSRSLDWGSSHPFSVGWWAECNGEEAKTLRGASFCPKPGTLIQIAEIYGTEELGTNVGLRWSAHKIAEEIIKVEKHLLSKGWISTQPEPGPADNQISDVRESDVDTIEKKMESSGVCWTKSDKSPGSRKNGLQLIRDRLEASTLNEGPGLLWMENCRASISTLPLLPRDDEDMDDVDTEAEDHAYDMVRYRVLANGPRYAKFVEVTFPS